jgi:hypothetical protein
MTGFVYVLFSAPGALAGARPAARATAAARIGRVWDLMGFR